MAQQTLTPENSVLLIIDIQPRLLAAQPKGEKILKNTKKLASAARLLNIKLLRLNFLLIHKLLKKNALIVLNNRNSKNISTLSAKNRLFSAEWKHIYVFIKQLRH